MSRHGAVTAPCLSRFWRANITAVPPLRGTTGLTYNSKNQLTGGTGTGLGTFAYDGNGNPTTYNGTSLTFDPNNKLTSVGSALTAGYGIDGLRAWKQNTATGHRTYYLYHSGVPIVEMDSSGNVTATNTFGANGLVSRNTVASGTVFYTFDEKGNTAERLDGMRNVLSAHATEGYGLTQSTMTVSDDPFDGYGAKFGYYTDHETGLVLCTNRYYDPATARWLTRDPAGYGGGINLYSYCGNNPINFADPLGLAPGYWGQVGQFALGELEGFGNFAAGSFVGGLPELVYIDRAMGGRMSHPFGSGCDAESVQDGAGFSNGLATVASFLTPEGAETAAEKATARVSILERPRALVLGSNGIPGGFNPVGEALPEIIRQELAEGRGFPRYGTDASAFTDPDAFLTEASQYDRIYWVSKGLKEHYIVTLAEYDVLLKNPSLWPKIYFRW